MIHATVVGNLGAEPEMKYAGDGTPILNLRVAASSRKKVDGEWKDVPTWCAVSVFGKRAESLAKLLEKGSKVAVRGELSVREYDKRDGGRGYSVDVRADEVELLSGKPGGSGYSGGGVGGQRGGGSRPAEQRGGGGGHQQQAAPAPAPAEPDYGDDDIPF